MAKLGNIRERVHYAYELTTPGDIVLPGDQSFILLQVAVPPKQDVVDSDVFYLTVGDNEPSFQHPLRPLMDMYRSELGEAADVYLRIEKQFAAIIDAVSSGVAKLDKDALQSLHGLHRKLRFGHTAADTNGSAVHFVPQTHAAVGVLIARAICVPPRATLKAHCAHGSKVTVYVGGLASRPVT
jgi:hypothetical protein